MNVFCGRESCGASLAIYFGLGLVSTDRWDGWITRINSCLFKIWLNIDPRHRLRSWDATKWDDKTEIGLTSTFLLIEVMIGIWRHPNSWVGNTTEKNRVCMVFRKFDRSLAAWKWHTLHNEVLTCGPLPFSTHGVVITLRQTVQCTFLLLLVVLLLLAFTPTLAINWAAGATWGATLMVRPHTCSPCICKLGTLCICKVGTLCICRVCTLCICKVGRLLQRRVKSGAGTARCVWDIPGDNCGARRSPKGVHVPMWSVTHGLDNSHVISWQQIESL